MKRQDQPLFVPATAVMFDARGTRAAVVSNGVVAWKNVVIDGDFGDRLAISTGLAAGDMVAVTPSERLVEGMHIESEEVKPGATSASPAPTKSPTETPAEPRRPQQEPPPADDKGQQGKGTSK